MEMEMEMDPFLPLVVEETLSNLISAVENMRKEVKKVGKGARSEFEKIENYVRLSTLSRELVAVRDSVHGTSNPPVKPNLESCLKKIQVISFEIYDFLDELPLQNTQYKNRKDAFTPIDSNVLNAFTPDDSDALNTFTQIYSRLTEIGKDFKEPESSSGQATERSEDLKKFGSFSSQDSTFSELDLTETTPIDLRLSSPVMDEGLIVGRDDDVTNVLDMLVRDSSHSSPLKEKGKKSTSSHILVIAIVGMRGVGKTALAKLIYNNETVVKHFSKRFWICANDGNFGVDIFKGARRKIRHILSTKKCLLVLDDVCNEDDGKWDDIRYFLRWSAAGSVILTTTCRERALSIRKPFFSYRLNQLTDDDSWDLFQRVVFNENGEKATPELGAYCQQLVKQMGGLPSAIRASADLWTRLSSGQREANKEFTTFPRFHSLRPRFDHLPSTPIKLCFTFCATLPKGSRIYKDELVQKWMAQGYIIPSVVEQNLTMEDTGEVYFQSLLRSSLMQNAERDEYGEIVSCSMDDDVHDLARYISHKTGVAHGDRHLSFSPHECENLEPSIGSSSTLPSELSHSHALGNQISLFTRLYSLSLVETDIDELPSPVSSLKHLRYLDISRTPIKRVPNSVAYLSNLQTFRILNCLFLEQFPKEFHKLLNLRHFYMDDDENRKDLLPTGLGQLSSLQTLPFFVVDPKRGRKIKELGQLSNLKGDLKIYSLEHVKGKHEARKAKLAHRSRIHALKFHWSIDRASMDIYDDESVLEGLEPHVNLKGLIIENFEGLKLASWMTVRSASLPLPNLVKLKLKNCARIKEVPMLGHIPSLKVLSMEGMHSLESIGSTFYGVAEDDSANRAMKAVFPALRELMLSDMPKLVEWCNPYNCARKTMFPRLKKLVIEGCPLLISAPSEFPALKELVVEDITSSGLWNIVMSLTTLKSFVIDMATETNTHLVNLLANNNRLKHLRVQRCEDLLFIPEDIWNHPFLESLEIWDCPNLEYIPDIVESQTLISLIFFSICGCNGLKSLPKGLHKLKHLETLFICGCNELELVEQLDTSGLTSLQKLRISDCDLVTFSNDWPHWLLLLTGLKDLTLGPFSKETDYFSFPTSFGSLQKLTLEGWPNCKFLPTGLQSFASLVELRIVGFEKLEVLPERLGNFSSLEYLQLWHCKKLEYFPSKESMRCLKKLRTLDIGGCPLLEKRCKNDLGSEWDKINHIPSIRIGNNYIQRRRW